jgi:hypothetical protein
MPNNQLSIETAQVEIKIIRVGGHKMTASVFNQIPEENFAEFILMSDAQEMLHEIRCWASAYLIGLDLAKDAANILGWVSYKDCDYYIFVGSEGELLKTYIKYPQLFDNDIDLGYVKLKVKEGLSQLYISI